MHSSLTNQVRLSSQSSSRLGATIDTYLIHHQAGTNDDAVIAAMVSGSRQVSANYTISNEGRITCVVPEELRAFTSGSSTDGGKGAAWDRRSITVEIENEAAGGTWPISDAALNAAAALLRDLRSRYPITNVLGHRDLWERYRASYSTFCPGPETVNRIVALAGDTTPKKRRNTEMTDLCYYVPTADPKHPTIKAKSIWYQKNTGAPVMKMTDDFTTSIEYAAWIAINGGMSRVETTAAKIAELIALRGLGPAKESSSGVQIDYGQLADELAERVTFPTPDVIATEVIRQQKLPGN